MLRYKLSHILNKGNLVQDRVMCEYSKSMYFSSLLIHGGGKLRHSGKTVLWLTSQCD